MEEIKDRCISRKEYLKRDDSNVGYALHVQNNIKKDDYARFNTGEIVKVTGIRENQVNKKAIYFGAYDEDWCDSAAVENFSENIIDLIEVGDYVNGYRIDNIINGVLVNRAVGIDRSGALTPIVQYEQDIKTILTKERYMQNCYTVEGKEEWKKI